MCVVGNKVVFKAHQAPGWAVISGGTWLRGEARLWQWEGWFRQQHWRLLFLLDLKAQACIFLQNVSELSLQGVFLLGCRCKCAVWGWWGVPSPPERFMSPCARVVQGDEGALRDDAALGPEQSKCWWTPRGKLDASPASKSPLYKVLVMSDLLIAA